MKSITYGNVSYERMYSLIKKYIAEDRSKLYHITVGTDSQNFDFTKVVLVVAVWRVGNGGIFFYDEKIAKKITSIKQKILYETSTSLEIARKLSEKMADVDDSYDIEIHVDAGQAGLSSMIIPQIVGWVKGCGFECKTKPDSYTASCIANRYTK